MEQENEKQPKLTPKQKFVIRFIIWCLFACILPVAFIIWRYDLFRVVSKMQIGGWGLVAIIIIVTFCITVLKYIKAGMVKWSMAKQIISGMVKVVVPLLALFFGVEAMKDSIDTFLQALGCTILCEIIAIPINPMPEWVYQQSQGQTEDVINYYFERRENKDKEVK